MAAEYQSSSDSGIFQGYGFPVLEPWARPVVATMKEHRMEEIAVPVTGPESRRKLIRIVGLYLVVTVCGAASGFIVNSFAQSLLFKQAAGYRDFVVYWATGQQLVHHANPYDGASLLAVERSAGYPREFAVMYMRNLPWTLPFVYPLGLLPSRPAFLLWSFLLLLLIGVCVRLLWNLVGRAGSQRQVLGYSFAPALVCLIAGQTSLFSLLGLVLFLRLHQSRPFWAGAALWLCALKPHLFLPFGVVLLLWIVVSRNYRLLLGAVSALAASCLLAYWIDPQAWAQYQQMVQVSDFKTDFIPCFSFLLRYFVNLKWIWLQFIFAGLGSLWAIYYYWTHRRNWDWLREGSLLMLVSILVAPYAWVYDQSLALPAVLRGVALARSREVLGIVALLSALIEIAQFSGHWWHTAPFLWTLWSAPAWLTWYYMVNRAAEKASEKQPDAPVEVPVHCDESLPESNA